MEVGCLADVCGQNVGGAGGDRLVECDVGGGGAIGGRAVEPGVLAAFGG